MEKKNFVLGLYLGFILSVSANLLTSNIKTLSNEMVLIIFSIILLPALIFIAKKIIAIMKSKYFQPCFVMLDFLLNISSGMIQYQALYPKTEIYVPENNADSTAKLDTFNNSSKQVFDIDSCNIPPCPPVLKTPNTTFPKRFTSTPSILFEEFFTINKIQYKIKINDIIFDRFPDKKPSLIMPCLPGAR